MCSHAWAPRNHILTCNAIRGQSRRAQCLGRNDGHHATGCVKCPASLGSSRPTQKRRGLRQHTWPRGHGASGSCLARPLTMSTPDGRGGAWSSDCPAGSNSLHAFLVSTGIVALAELGDSTQLLAYLLPDKLDEGDTRLGRHRVFATTLIVFFLAEMGDKTQIATVALVAQYHDFMFVVAGTTLGMMIANVPAVLVGERIAARMPVRLVHGIAAAIFVLLGVATLLGAGERRGF